MSTENLPANGQTANAATTLTKKDFVSDQDVRWCPGCGDYSILAQLQRVLPDLGIPKEQFVFVSGIGCSSRFPYYMNTYGFHTIHGRAPAFATGIKASRPDLSVWVVTGDGDGLSIGGNHLIHTMRRNVDLNIMLFNNRIYGLTKGQYSPTSEIGKVTKSSPMGSVEQPFSPISLALACEATFVARTIDVEAKHLQEVLRRAAEHKGVSFVEIFQNCNIFNDGAFSPVTEKTSKIHQQLRLVHGEPMRFGEDGEKGIRLNGLTPEIVTVGEDGITEGDLLVHDEASTEPTLALFLSRFSYPDFPTPIGVFRDIQKPTYDEAVNQQIASASEGMTDAVETLQSIVTGSSTWTIE